VRPLQLEQDGAELFEQALDAAELAALERTSPETSGPGVRLHGKPDLNAWLSTGPIGDLCRSALGGLARPVRAILFDKTAEANWTLGWHQDRTIVVRERVDVDGFGHWSIKAGAIHVEPPFELLHRMVTVRIHLDPVSPGNAPLLIVPGSHLLGRIEEQAIDNVVKRAEPYACLAARGDAWLYRTAILHASGRSEGEGRRRVLQVDFSADELPGGLCWLGVG
jgi:hypothetical protein